MRYLVLVLLMIGFVAAVDVDFDCPDEIFVDEEFECSLEVFDGDGEYDVKIDLDGERNSVLQMWNDGAWKSGYFYLQEFIEDGDEENIRLKISEEGNWDGVLKLRQGDKREFFDIEIEISQSVIVEEFITDSDWRSSSQSDGGLDGGIIILREIVSLSSAEEIDELVYVSKNGRIADWLPYGFALFLIFVIGILLWERF